MYKKGAGNDKQGKDAGNRTLCRYRNFSHGDNTENPIFKLYIRNFINISSFYNLLDVTSYTEISSTMKSIHSLD